VQTADLEPGEEEDEISKSEYDDEIDKELQRHLKRIKNIIASDPFKRSSTLLSNDDGSNVERRQRSDIPSMVQHALMRYCGLYISHDLRNYSCKIKEKCTDCSSVGESVYNRVEHGEFKTFGSFPSNLKHLLFGIMQSSSRCSNGESRPPPCLFQMMYEIDEAKRGEQVSLVSMKMKRSITVVQSLIRMRNCKSPPTILYTVPNIVRLRILSKLDVQLQQCLFDMGVIPSRKTIDRLRELLICYEDANPSKVLCQRLDMYEDTVKRVHVFVLDNFDHITTEGNKVGGLATSIVKLRTNIKPEVRTQLEMSLRNVPLHSVAGEYVDDNGVRCKVLNASPSEKLDEAKKMCQLQQDEKEYRDKKLRSFMLHILRQVEADAKKVSTSDVTSSIAAPSPEDRTTLSDNHNESDQSDAATTSTAHAKYSSTYITLTCHHCLTYLPTYNIFQIWKDLRMTYPHQLLRLSLLLRQRMAVISRMTRTYFTS